MSEPFKDPSKIAYANDAPKLKFNPGGLIASLIRTGWDFAKGYPSEATLAEWAKTITQKEGKERQAFNLVANSIIKACYTQVRHRFEQVDIDDSGNPLFEDQEIRFHVFDSLKENEYVFDCHHRANPQAFPLLHDLKPFYKQWLQETFQLPEAQAGDLARDFPNYFAYELYQLLLKKPKDYEDLINWCDSPFNEALQTNLARQRYQAELRNKYHQPALGERAVSLSDVYVQPSFLVYERMLEDETLKRLRMNGNNVRQEHFIHCGFDGSIHDYLQRHFLTSTTYKGIKPEVGNSRLLVLLGQPGHGKSSFCYRSIFDLLQADDIDCNAFFVRLQSFDDKALAEPMAEVIQQLPPDLDYEAWVDAKQGQKSLLFLDGLDEFCMTQSLTDAQVIGFIQKCKKWTERNPLLHIVVTSRFNYVETAKLHDHDCQLLSLGMLDLAQQHDLVTRYMVKMADQTCHLTLQMLEKINKEEQYKHVKELIELPILLQMVLIAQVNVEAAGSRAAIYDQLFTQVLSRKWDKEGKLKKYKDTDKFSEKHLRKYLAFLAFRIFQSRRGYLNKSDIESYNETKDFSKKLKLENEGEELKPVLKDILTSFYLNETRKDGSDRLQADKDNEYAIEFLHKSLYEYLACEYIWVAVKEYFLEKEPDGDGYKTRSTEEVQQQMQKLFANVRLTKETLEYLKEIIAGDTTPHKDLAEEMSWHFAKLLKHGFLYEYKANHAEAPLYRPEQMVLNIFHVYWAILGSLRLHEVEVGRFMETEWGTVVAKELDEKKIDFIEQAFHREMEVMIDRNWRSIGIGVVVIEGKDSFSSWIKGLRTTTQVDSELKHRRYEVWVRRNLLKEHAFAVMEYHNKAISGNIEELTRYLRLAAAEPMEMSLNLQHINLQKINFKGIQAEDIYLLGADISNANLENVNLSKANFENTNLGGVNLAYADLWGTNFSNAFLGSAFLFNASFHNANLRNANLVNAHLHNAFLQNAILENANLEYADIEGAFLGNASFRNANLRNANLRDTDLRNADLCGANLEYADLRDAKLTYAKVSDKAWLTNLHNIWVIGAGELEKKYKLIPENQNNRYKRTLERYVIVEIEPSTGEVQ